MRQFIDSTEKQISKKIAEFPWICAIFSIGVILRISGFTVGVIWYDELFSLESTHQDLFIMINALKGNISPPGWETLLWFVVRFFGWNAFSLRLPSVIASIITLWIMYKIGIALKFTKGQLIASMAVAALLPYQLISAQQGRVYALFSMFYLLGLYAALTKRWLILGISAAALFWCHNVSFMFVPALFMIALFVHPKNWKRIILVFFLTALTFIPWLFKVTLTQSATLILLFPTLSTEFFIFSFLIALFGYNMPSWGLFIAFLELLTICFGAVIFPLVNWILMDMRKDIESLKSTQINIRIWIANLVANKNTPENSLSKSRSKWILFFAFAIPLLLLTLASMLVQNVIIFRTIYPLTIPLLLWLISIYVVPQPNIFHKILWGISVILLIIGVISWAPSQPGGDLENLENIVNKSFREEYDSLFDNIIQPGDAFLHDTGYTAIVFKYYFPDKANYVMDGNDVVGLKDIQITNVQIPQAAPEDIPAQRLWVVWTRDPTISEINKNADERTYQLITKYNCPMISDIRYSQSFYIEVYLCDLHQK